MADQTHAKVTFEFDAEGLHTMVAAKIAEILVANMSPLVLDKIEAEVRGRVDPKIDEAYNEAVAAALRSLGGSDEATG